MKETLIHSGQKVCIVGLGVTGKAAIRYCQSRGAEVCLSDMRPENQLLQEEGDFLREHQLAYECGGHRLAFLAGCDVVLPSPGVDLRQEPFSLLALEKPMVLGELAVVAGELDSPVIAVTGSNGKTTVTTLLAEVLRAAGKRVFVGGNIGTPVYEYCLSPEKYDVAVLEVSSFQLECCAGFAPDAAVLLNITADHLDRYSSIAQYAAAKASLFADMKEGGLAVISGDDRLCRDIELPSGVRRQTFGFSADCSLRIGEKDFVCSKGSGEKQRFAYDSDRLTGFAASNYAAAYLVLQHFSVDSKTIARGFQEFQAPPHRLEQVTEIGGVSFVNDSKATNTGAVIGALKRIQGNVILIAGGRGKGENYRSLRECVRERVGALILIGEAAEALAADLGDLVSCLRAGTLDEAVGLAFECAAPGDTVLFSPACASFDMFTGYAQRGIRFREAVGRLAETIQKRQQPEKTEKKIRLLLTGGGTGGHLFPAVAAAEQFVKGFPDTEILFVGTKRKMDAGILAEYGFNSAAVHCYGLKGKSLLKLVFALVSLPWAYMQSLWLVRRFRPDCILGVGGYVTGPVIAAGKTLGVACIIHEQNSLPGLANRQLGRIADRVCLSLPGPEHFFDAKKIVYTGNPVRESIRQLAKKTRPGNAEKCCLLVLGGSLGAEALNRLLPEAAALLPAAQKARLRVIHQTGVEREAGVAEAYKKSGVEALAEPFIKEMAEVYAQADFVVSRAGATTLAELSVAGKPAILIPYPYAADNHQKKNAECYVQGKGALLHVQEQLTPEKLAIEIERLLVDAKLRDEMSSAMKKLSSPDAAERIVACCLECIQACE